MGDDVYQRPLSRCAVGVWATWSWLHELSLDVSLGALGLSVMISRALGAEATSAEHVALWAAVSLIYTADHLLDAAAQGASLSQRRAKHALRRASLRALCLISALTGLGSMSYLQPISLWLGGSLSGLCGLYLWLAQRGARPLSAHLKKACVCLVYPAGVCLPSVAGLYAKGEGLELQSFGLLGTGVLALALANLSIFELAEREAKGHPTSFEGLWRALIAGLALSPLWALLTPSIWSDLSPQLRAALITLSLIGLAHALVSCSLKPLIREERYRRLADGAFLLSWLSLWI